MTGNEQCILLKTDYNTHYEHQALNIVGEVDIRLSDFHKGEEEMMLVGVPENHQCDFFEHDAVYIKYEEGKREDAEAAVRRVLRRFDVPEEKIMLSSLDEYISGNYKEETYYANLLSALTVFSVLITFSGVFSMLLYSFAPAAAEHGHPPGDGRRFPGCLPASTPVLFALCRGGRRVGLLPGGIAHAQMDGIFPLWRNAGRGTDGGHRVRYMRGGVAHRLWTGASLHERQAGGSAPAGIVIRYNCFSFSGTVPVRMLSVQGQSFCATAGAAVTGFSGQSGRMLPHRPRHDGAASGRIRSGGLLFAVDGWASPGRMQDGSAEVQWNSNRGTPCRRLGRRLSGILRQTDGCGPLRANLQSRV